MTKMMPPDTGIELSSFYEAHEGKVSDKWASYLSYYGNLLSRYRDRPVRILEIGIQNGGSLEIWSRFFPNALQIVGCDINERCHQLVYDDPRISVVVGDANDPDVFSKIMEISAEYDIIIDDGSHVSDDVVRSFAIYFPHLVAGGTYIAEDMHCGYWRHFKGGIEAPYSSISFFKRLADFVNLEHWGAPVPPSEALSFFSNFWNAKFADDALISIDEVAFRNSIVVVSKGELGGNSLGKRIVRGQIAVVEPRVHDMAETGLVVPDESSNATGPLTQRTEALAFSFREQSNELTKAEFEITQLRASYESARLELVSTKAQLHFARRRPHRLLMELAVYRVARILAKIPAIIPESTRQGLARIAAKHDPRRGESIDS